MAESKADFSKIIELQEVQRLHDESQERHRMELAEKDEIIHRLQDELQERDQPGVQAAPASAAIDETVAATQREAAAARQDLEAKIARLQARVKELSAAKAADPGSSATRRGFFSR